MRRALPAARAAARWTFAAAAAATAAVLAVAALAHVARAGRRSTPSERATERVLASHPRCFGAAARDPRAAVRNPRLRLAVVPTPLQAAQARQRAVRRHRADARVTRVRLRRRPAQRHGARSR